MEKNTKTSETFCDFAEKELENHLAELNTRYQNKPIGSKELKQEAFEEQKENELLQNQKDEPLRNELYNLKKRVHQQIK